MLCIETIKRMAMILKCFPAKYPQGRAVKIAVRIAPKKLKEVNIMASAVLDFAEKTFNVLNVASVAKYPCIST